MDLDEIRTSHVPFTGDGRRDLKKEPFPSLKMEEEDHLGASPR